MNNQNKHLIVFFASSIILVLLLIAHPNGRANAQDVPPSLTPKLGHIPITAQNIAQVKQIMQIGDGGAQGVCWSPDGDTLGVATTIGLYLYDARNWTKTPIPFGPQADISGCGWSPHSRYLTLTNGKPSNLVP